MGDSRATGLVIQADDAVIIRVVRSEMGQGTITGLAQLLAEELAIKAKSESQAVYRWRLSDTTPCR